LTQSVKRKYEAMFLVDSAVATASWEEVEGAINTIMKRAEAEIVSLRKWDERRLCFEIQGRKRGTYLLCYFNASPSALQGIERDVQIDETVLRILILNAERIPAELVEMPTPAEQAEEVSRDEEQTEEKVESNDAQAINEPAAEPEEVEKSADAGEVALQDAAIMEEPPTEDEFEPK